MSEVKQPEGYPASQTFFGITIPEGTEYTETLVMFQGPEATERFWQLTCSCGVTAYFPVNGLPTVDTPHPCGKPNHWSVRYRDLP